MPNLDISVRNPITHNTWENGRYTSYEIAIDTTNKSFCLGHSVCRRRYSEFVWLCKRLKSRHPRVTPPSLPPKTFLKERFDHSFIALRMKGLEEFLCRLLTEKLYMSDSGVHLFIQTNLSCQEIDDFMSGKLSAEAIDSVWKAQGVKEHSSAFGDESYEDLSEDFLPKGSNLIQVEDKLSDCSSFEQEDDVSSMSTGDEVEYPSISLVGGYLGNKQDNLSDIGTQSPGTSVQDKLSDEMSQASSHNDSGISCREISGLKSKFRTSSPIDVNGDKFPEPSDTSYIGSSNQFSIN